MASGTIPSEFENVTGTITPTTGNTIANAVCVRAGNVVSLYCEVSGDYSSNSVLCTLPEGFRPKTVQRLPCRHIFNGTERFYYVRVLTTGEIDIRYSNTHSTFCAFGGTIVL